MAKHYRIVVDVFTVFPGWRSTCVRGRVQALAEITTEESFVHRRYRTSIIGGLVVFLFAAWAAVNAQVSTSSAEPSKPVFTFSSDAAIVTVLIKPDKTADFESVLSRLKEALQKSENPRRKEQAAGWKVFKSAQLAQGNAVYVMRIDPVVKGEEYDITRLIAEVFPVEVQDLFAKYKESFAGRGVTELSPFMSMHD